MMMHFRESKEKRDPKDLVDLRAQEGEVVLPDSRVP